MAAKTQAIDEVPSVLLEAVAARLGGRLVEVLAANLNGQLERDWAGRLVVTAAVARQLVEGYDFDQRRRNELQAAWDAFAEQREAERDSVYADAVRAAARKELRESRRELTEAGHVGEINITLPYEAQQRCGAVGRQALEKWDRKHPAPSFAEFERDPERWLK